MKSYRGQDVIKLLADRGIVPASTQHVVVDADSTTKLRVWFRSNNGWMCAVDKSARSGEKFVTQLVEGGMLQPANGVHRVVINARQGHAALVYASMSTLPECWDFDAENFETSTSFAVNTHEVKATLDSLSRLSSPVRSR